MVRICGLFGMTRQAYYHHFWRQSDISAEEAIVLEMVREIRVHQPKIGVRKLQKMIAGKLCEHQIKMGRDLLFELLARHGMLVKRRKVKPHTTNSRHWYKKYPNIAIDIVPDGINQLWASDITYLPTESGFVYLSLITDTFSRKVVGSHVSSDLSALNNVIALKQAIKSIEQPTVGLIHHSDRGSQYCSKEYTDVLKKHRILISMTENGDPRENAIAERINGTIKNELLEHIKIQGLSDAKQKVLRAIAIYNNERPHQSCGYLTPQQAHSQEFEFKREWKSYYKKKTNEESLKN